MFDCQSKGIVYGIVKSDDWWSSLLLHCGGIEVLPKFHQTCYTNKHNVIVRKVMEQKNNRTNTQEKCNEIIIKKEK